MRETPLGGNISWRVRRSRVKEQKARAPLPENQKKRTII
jgi:hypothetical protein